MTEWTATIEGASKARLLNYNGIPVAKFYADRLSRETQAQIASILTSLNFDAPELENVK